MGNSQSFSGIVIYARISSKGQLSLDDQIARCHEALSEFTYSGSIITFKDVGSGTNPHKLTGLNHMYDHVIKSTNNLVLVYDLSRLGRFPEIFKFAEDIMVNSTILSVTENIMIGRRQTRSFDLQLAQTKFQEAIQFSISLSKRIKDAYRLKKKRGQFMGRKAPYGFKLWKPRRGVVYLVKDPLHFKQAQALARRKTLKIRGEVLPVNLLKHKTSWRKNLRLAKIGQREFEADN